MSADPAVWFDAGWWLMPNGTRRLLSWNAATKELKLWSLQPHERDDDVLAIIQTEDEVRARLAGWSEHNDTKEGIAWLAQRLEGLR